MGKLLLVEDDRIIAGIYQRKFGAEGYQVTTVTDGEAALRSLEAAKPDLVILDIMLSKLNGIQVLKALRGTEELKDVPVIVFSNAYQPKIIDDAWQAGATMVLMKANTSPAKLSEIRRGARIQIRRGERRTDRATQRFSQGNARLCRTVPGTSSGLPRCGRRSWQTRIAE
jgi:two-component system response regulator MprA